MGSALLNGHAEKGDSVAFRVIDGKTGPEASDVAHCHGSLDAAPGFDAAPAGENRRYVGTVKSYVADKGWGMIECAELFFEYGKDMFVLKSSLPSGNANKGDRVQFSVIQGSKGPEAAQVTFLKDAHQSRRTRP